MKLSDEICEILKKKFCQNCVCCDLCCFKVTEKIMKLVTDLTEQMIPKIEDDENGMERVKK